MAGKFVALTWAERLLLARAFVHVLKAWFLVRVLPYSRLKPALESINSHEVAHHQSYELQPIKWSVEAISRRVPGSSCLVQAIAGTRLFRECGYKALLKLGVARPNQHFDAHAWVELDGGVVLGGNNSPDLFTTLAVPERRDAR